MKIRYRYEHDILILVLLENMLDVQFATHFEKLVRSQKAESLAMVVDLGELREMDAKGVGVLTRLALTGVTFCGLRHELKQLIDCFHTCNFYPRVEEALHQTDIPKHEDAKAKVCSLLLDCGLL